MIQFEHVCKTYGKTPILKDLNFTIPDGQFVVLIGPSGCGKTTTLKTINRLIDIDSGTISIDGKDIHSQDKVELRRHIGYVIQQIGLFPNMTVEQNILCALKKEKDPAARRAACAEALRAMRLEELAKRLPGILPPLTREEAVETTKIYSIAGQLPQGRGLISARPFRLSLIHI